MLFVPARWLAPAALLVAFLPSAPAAAQERLRLDGLGDEALYQTTLRDENAAGFLARADGFGGVAGTVVPGGVGFVAPVVGLQLGVWDAPTRFLQLTTEASMPATSWPSSPTWRDVEGSHKLRATIGLGPLEKHAGGADVELVAHMDHASAFTTSFLRRDLPAVPFWSGSAEATLWGRYCDAADSAAALPVSVRVSRVRFEEAGTMRGYDAARVASGIGAKFYGSNVSKAWIEIAGVSWEHIRFEPRESFAAGREKLERIDMRVLDAEAFAVADKTMQVHFGMSTGGSWVWDPISHEGTSNFVFSLKGSVHAENDEGKESIGAGAAIVRDAGFTADGAALTRGFRAEGFFEGEIASGHLGGSVRASAAQQSILVGAGEDGVRGAVATEWWIAPVLPLQLGAYHTATDRCPVALGAPPELWCHQLGVFVRVRAGAGPHVPGRIQREWEQEAQEQEREREPPPSESGDADDSARAYPR